MADEAALQRQQRQARLARGAARQWGNVTRAQILAAGFTAGELRGMAARSVLLPRHRGVYALGHVSPTPESRWAAGLLAGGPQAALIGTTAMALHGLMDPPATVEIAVPTQRRGDDELLVRERRIPVGDVTSVRELRVTTICRTLLDLAAIGERVQRLAHEALASRRVDIKLLRRYAADHASDHGGPRLLAALAAPHTRSREERRLLAFLQRRGLPIPEMNAPVGRLSVDALFAELGLAVELDFDQTHGSSYAVKRDAWRDRYVRARGLEPVRIGADDLELLASELERRRART
jgi:very-short-patch-repair endonuclease